MQVRKLLITKRQHGLVVRALDVKSGGDGSSSHAVSTKLQFHGRPSITPA